ncbi:MAG: hypothetical protein NPIRA04_10450 [Nitrospirales bacterium]|nr:MAG: hypothetical protein NPIRA04_10450 [Nitrospirales bacterium]
MVFIFRAKAISYWHNCYGTIYGQNSIASPQRPKKKFFGQSAYSFFPPDELDEEAEEADPLDEPEDVLPDDPVDGVDPDELDELELLSLAGVDEEPLSDFPSAFVSAVFSFGFPSSPGRLGSLSLSE